MTDEVQHTALTSHHEAAGARLGPFAGWSMPIRFTGTLAEHEAVRTSVGVFDVSHLGTVWIEGPAALDVVAATFTNDPARLDDGRSQYTLCCTDDGGIVDDLIVYRLAADRWMTVPNAANTADVVAALRIAADGSDATVRDESTAYAVLAVQGPDALPLVDRVLADLGATTAVSDIPYLGVSSIEVAGNTAVACRTGYTGEPGCELVVPNAVAEGVWTRLVHAGALPCGLGARDTLRLEMGYPLHGNELSVDTSPYEARLGWAVKADRDGDFRGKRALQAAKAAGTSRRLWGLLVDGRRPARESSGVSRDGAPVGVLTSGTLSPTLGRPVALAYLDASIDDGDEVTIDVRGSEVGATVTRPPFVDRSPKP